MITWQTYYKLVKLASRMDAPLLLFVLLPYIQQWRTPLVNVAQVECTDASVKPEMNFVRFDGVFGDQNGQVVAP